MDQEGVVSYNKSPWGQRSLTIINWIWIAKQLGIPKDLWIITARILHTHLKPTMLQIRDARAVMPFPNQDDIYEFCGHVWVEATTRMPLLKCTLCHRPTAVGGRCKICKYLPQKKKKRAPPHDMSFGSF